MAKLAHALGPKAQWAIVKSLINPNKDPGVRKIEHNNSTITNPLDIGNVFNSYFANIGPSLAAKFGAFEPCPFGSESNCSMHL